jgi:ABC-type amino acid transport substrate-binding protein
MRRFTKLLLVALAVMLVAAACSSSDSAGDLDGRTIKVAVENAYPPYNYIPEGATAGEGWDYDAWNEICKRLNCTAEFVEAGWPAVIVETGQGQYDTAADGISITEERKEVVAFSDPYMVIEQKFMVRDDDFSLVSSALSVSRLAGGNKVELSAGVRFSNARLTDGCVSPVMSRGP